MPKEIDGGDGDTGEPLLRRGVWRPDETQAVDECIEDDGGHGEKSSEGDGGDDDAQERSIDAQEHGMSKEYHKETQCRHGGVSKHEEGEPCGTDGSVQDGPPDKEDHAQGHNEANQRQDSNQVKEASDAPVMIGLDTTAR